MNPWLLHNPIVASPSWPCMAPSGSLLHSGWQAAPRAHGRGPLASRSRRLPFPGLDLAERSVGVPGRHGWGWSCGVGGRLWEGLVGGRTALGWHREVAGLKPSWLPRAANCSSAAGDSAHACSQADRSPNASSVTATLTRPLTGRGLARAWCSPRPPFGASCAQPPGSYSTPQGTAQYAATHCTEHAGTDGVNRPPTSVSALAWPYQAGDGPQISHRAMSQAGWRGQGLSLLPHACWCPSRAADAPHLCSPKLIARLSHTQ